MTNSSKKFDLQGILSNIKSMISPEGNTPNVNPDDAIGMKVAGLSVLIRQLAKTYAKQSKEFTKVNRLLNELFKDIEAFRNSSAADSPEPSEFSVSSKHESSEETKETK